MTSLDTLKQAAQAPSAATLPDGSAFAIASFPLPLDHWLYAPREYEGDSIEPKELPAPILTHAQRDAVVAAIRYAVRGATMCGMEKDFDPDALVQNAVYALCGPFSSPKPEQAPIVTPEHDAKVRDVALEEAAQLCERLGHGLDNWNRPYVRHHEVVQAMHRIRKLKSTGADYE